MWSEDECCVCGKKGPDVYERECGYVKEMTGDVHLEVICDDCEGQHVQDV